MSKTQSFVLDANTDAPIHGVAHFPTTPGPQPTVLICHGFKGFMEWGFFPPLAELLADRGFTAVRFNYTGSGMKPGDELVTDLDAFRLNTFSRERDETLRVLAALGDEIAPGRVDTEKIGLVGHSRGGGASILVSAHPEWKDRLGALVTWAAVSTWDRFGGEKTKKAWRAQGTLPIKNARTGQELQLGVELLEDMEGNREALDILAAAGRREAPWLIVHGADDEAVPAPEAEALNQTAGGEHELLMIPDAGHTFNAKHPFAGPTPQLIEAMNATQTWLRRHLC